MNRIWKIIYKISAALLFVFSRLFWGIGNASGTAFCSAMFLYFAYQIEKDD